MEFAVATFCFGQRYYEQANRFIESFIGLKEIPNVIVVTDKTDQIKKTNFTKVFNIEEFNPEYLKYSDCYQEFDFSVKRYSLRACLNLGYNKVLLTDADALVNKLLFSERIHNVFEKDSILGPITYNFEEEIESPSSLGKRLTIYEKELEIEINKKELDFMPEDCTNYLNIETSKFESFLSTWDKCIKIKKEKNLINTPAGNIDEICFSALANKIKVKKTINLYSSLVTHKHDIWYR